MTVSNPASFFQSYCLGFFFSLFRLSGGERGSASNGALLCRHSRSSRLPRPRVRVPKRFRTARNLRKGEYMHLQFFEGPGRTFVLDGSSNTWTSEVKTKKSGEVRGNIRAIRLGSVFQETPMVTAKK